jgi:uncharacterized membrane protein
MKNTIAVLIILGITITQCGSDQSIAQLSKNVEFNVVGNEPFWNIKITKQGIIFKKLGEKKQTFPYIEPLSAQGRSIDKVRVYKLQGKGNDILILNQVGDCSDTMSDKNYPYSATLIMDNQVFEGCAEKKSK